MNIHPAKSSTPETLNSELGIQFEQVRGVLGFVLDNGEQGGDCFTIPHPFVISTIDVILSLLDTVANTHDELWQLTKRDKSQEDLHFEISIILSQCKAILGLVLYQGESGSSFQVAHSSIIASLGGVSRLLGMAANTHVKLWGLGDLEQAGCASLVPASGE